MTDDRNPRVNKALFVRLQAKPGKEPEVEAFLRDGLSAVMEEQDTTTTCVLGITFSSSSREVETFSDGIFISLCEVTCASPKRLSIAGLKTCTRCRAIWARRTRRISSSLLPLNMLPVTTSSHPGRDIRV